jgi:hypothetical protein
MEAIASEIGGVAGESRGFSVHAAAQNEPADMCPPRTFFGCVRIAWMVTVLVVYPMHGNPEDRPAFESECAADREQIFHPLRRLKAAMRQQPMVANTDSEVDGKHPQNYCNGKPLPAKAEQRSHSAHVEDCDKDRRNPVDAALVVRAAHPQFVSFGRRCLSV